ncbi:MTH938/NDUFAF3 family protein [Streptomyces sp. NPDC031705]|uniref:Mth938-like domain-containing protein n=1 Tax=Streptomyces sp. NPDC031705 TaxID=3155729 RepID=UPI0033FB498D
MNGSPLITHLSWGEMEAEGLARAKDFVLYPGGGHPWDWNRHGTRHDPGIRPGDVRELLDHGCTVVVLSQGMDRRLKTTPEALRLLHEADATVHVVDTEAAVGLYNRLARAAEPVGGLFHSTC